MISICVHKDKKDGRVYFYKCIWEWRNSITSFLLITKEEVEECITTRLIELGFSSLDLDKEVVGYYQDEYGLSLFSH